MRGLLGLALLLAASPVGGVETEPLRGLRAEVAALLVQGVPGGRLPLAVAVYARPAGAEAVAGLSFLVELPAAPAGGAEEGRRLEVYAYAVDGSGEVVAHSGVGLPRWPAEGEGVKIVGSLKAPAGEVSLRVLAWDPVGRRYGLAVRRIALGTAGPAPRIAEECAEWAVAGAPAAPELARLTARPVLVSGERRRLSLSAAAPVGAWRVRLESDAEEAGEGTVVEASVAAAGELEFVVPSLPPGVYRIAVAAPGEDSWSSPPLDAWLVAALPPAERGCVRSWTRVLRLARSGALAVEPTPEPPTADRKRPVRRLVAGYEALLGRLAAAGDLTASAHELARLEAPVAGDDPSRNRLLSQAELQVARSLAARDPRCLLPLIALHAEAYRVHHGMGSFHLASHSRRQARAVADLAAERLEAPRELALISVGLANLADLIEARRASIEAQRLLERALELDESHEAARLLLAVSYERKGRYAEARRQLEALVAANSAHHEARVRLAILLRRLGEAGPAERLLRAVVAERPPAWLLSLAYQTLAQLLIREARLGEARADLDEALDRLPGDQALQVLLAYALDRSGERQAVRETLAGLDVDAAARRPRYRYSDEAVAALGLLRETLRQSVTVRLPVLALALADGGQRGAEP